MGAQEWHIVSLLCDVTSPTTVAHYCRPLRQYDVSLTCSEHREALTAGPTAHGVHKQAKDEVHSPPLNK